MGMRMKKLASWLSSVVTPLSSRPKTRAIFSPPAAAATCAAACAGERKSLFHLPALAVARNTCEMPCSASDRRGELAGGGDDLLRAVAHLPLLGLVAERDGVDQAQAGEAHVLHGPDHRADVARVLGLDQHDMNSFQDFFHFFLVFSVKTLKL